MKGGSHITHCLYFKKASKIRQACMGELRFGVLLSSWGWNGGLQELEGSGTEECGRTGTKWGKVFILRSLKRVLFSRQTRLTQIQRDGTKIWHYIIRAGFSCGPSFHTVKQSKDTPGKTHAMLKYLQSDSNSERLNRVLRDFRIAAMQCFSKAVLIFFSVVFAG